MAKAPTSPDRLNHLLPWINGEHQTLDQIRRRLRAFLASFDGSASAGHIQVVEGAGQVELATVQWPTGKVRTTIQEGEKKGDVRELTIPPVPPPYSEQGLEELRARLLNMLQLGFPPERGYQAASGERLKEVTGLRFGVRRAQRRRPDKLSRESRSARRAYTAQGAYTLLVDGDLGALVLYLAAHLLTAPDMASVARCPAPAPYTRDERCGKFVITSGLGRPSVYCSEACRVRAHAERLVDQERASGITPRKRGPRPKVGKV